MQRMDYANIIASRFSWVNAVSEIPMLVFKIIVYLIQ